MCFPSLSIALPPAYRIQKLANEIIDLESKKKQSIDELAQLNDTLDWYHRNIKLNKQILAELDKKINQKQNNLNKRPGDQN